MLFGILFGVESILILIIIISIAALILNLPFGYLRAPTRKFSFLWFLYIHLPIPFIFVLRRSVGVGYQAIPLLFIGAIAGQVIGARIRPTSKD